MALLWKVNLPAGRVSGESDHGMYLIQADGSGRYWTVEYTHFPNDDVMRPIPPCPTGRFPSWDSACAACARHASACDHWPQLMRA